MTVHPPESDGKSMLLEFLPLKLFCERTFGITRRIWEIALNWDALYPCDGEILHMGRWRFILISRLANFGVPFAVQRVEHDRYGYLGGYKHIYEALWRYSEELTSY